MQMNAGLQMNAANECGLSKIKSSTKDSGEFLSGWYFFV